MFIMCMEGDIVKQMFFFLFHNVIVPQNVLILAYNIFNLKRKKFSKQIKIFQICGDDFHNLGFQEQLLFRGII